MDLTEAEDIKKRWQQHTEEIKKKKELNGPDNHDGVITHLEQTSWSASQVGLRKHCYQQR